MKDRIRIEDALKHLHECAYRGQAPSVESLSGALTIDRAQAADLLASLQARGLLEFSGSAYRLTEAGTHYALNVIRAHRLYETYLANETGVRAKDWHQRAEAKEHSLKGQDLDELSQRLGDPRYDPHGDPIPTPDGVLPPAADTPLLAHPPGWSGTITHVEDEPESVYADLVAEGLAPGMRIHLIEADRERVRLNAEGRIVGLRTAAAALIRAAPLPAGDRFDESVSRLSSLHEGESAIVVGLSPACRGPARNRLLDLGVVPGSAVEVDLRSPSGDPVAYRLRDASIALRREQAELILIRKEEEGGQL
jgi:DtxR family transcriptional regulator, Mn-dependent transcriptional regulator